MLFDIRQLRIRTTNLDNSVKCLKVPLGKIDETLEVTEVGCWQAAGLASPHNVTPALRRYPLKHERSMHMSGDVLPLTPQHQQPFVALLQNFNKSHSNLRQAVLVTVQVNGAQPSRTIKVPVTIDTTVEDVLQCCKVPVDFSCQVVLVIGNTKCKLTIGDRPWQLIKTTDGYNNGQLRLVVSTLGFLNHTGCQKRFRCCDDDLMKDLNSELHLLPDGSDVTVVQLQEMAAEQQHRIDAQQQMMVAKEQRLKYLKQQELRHQQISADRDRLIALRKTVETQELKLSKLRAMQGEVGQRKQQNTSLTSELETIRALFNEKEKELSIAVAKVEELTKQLEELRRGRQYIGNDANPSPAVLELEKLRKELLYRNKLNEQQNNRMVQQRETLNNRKDEVTRMDKRILELQQRLQRKRALNQQLANQINAATSAKQAQLRNVGKNGIRAMNGQNIAAVEPYNHMPSKEHDRAHDDLHTQLNSGNKVDELQEFVPNKNDPKYQTLPYNTKFLMQKQKQDLDNEAKEEKVPDKSEVKQQPSSKIISSSHSITNLTPKPFVSSSYPQNSSNDTFKKSISAPVITTPQIVTKLPTDNSLNAQVTTQNNNSNQVTESNQNLPVYQSCSMPVTVVHPHTFSSAPDGSLQEVAVDNNEETNKPALPPKPSVPNKPIIPRRLIHSTNGEKIDTSSKSVDSALNILKGSDSKSEKNLQGGDFKLRLLYYTHYNRPVGRNVISSFSKRVGSSALEQYMKSMNQLYKDSAAGSDSSSSEQSSTQNEETELKRLNQVELPIKPKPLTIKKSSSAEPPKLKSATNVPVSQISSTNGNRNTSSSVHVSTSRRIEIPPAFHFPELQKSDLQKNNEINEADDLTSKLVTPPNVVISPEPILTTQLNEEPCVEACKEGDINGNSIGQNNSEWKNSEVEKSTEESVPIKEPNSNTKLASKIKKGNLKTDNSVKNNRRVSFDPHALLLDASLEGELVLVKKTAKKVPNPSAANDEGITALHNAICAGHFEVVKFLVEFGCDVNAQDSDGWTPLHCAASCNNLPMVKFLVENGACIFATTLSDHETAAEKCEEDEEGFDGCTEYLYSIQEKLGILNNGTVFAVYDFEAHNADELSFNIGDTITVLRKGDEFEREWWWSRINDHEGYIPRNLLGLYPRRPPRQNQEPN